jgi:putative transcriptional regulator
MTEVLSKPYQYRECGLDNVWLIGGVDHTVTPRGTGITIQDIEGLHRVIGNILVRERKNLTGREFRFLRHEINMTQQNLAAVLGVDVQSVGRWERGESKGGIPRPAQGLIRLLYEEKANGNRQICEPLEWLAALDEQTGDEEEITLQETPDGWAIFSDAA